MNSYIITTISLNIGLILVILLVLSIAANYHLLKQKHRLLKQLHQSSLQKSTSASSTLKTDHKDHSLKLAEMEKSIKDKDAQIKSLLSTNIEQSAPPTPPTPPTKISQHSNNQKQAATLPTLLKNKAPFTTEIKELNAIIDNNRLFGVLQTYWKTLDTPPLCLMNTENIDALSHHDHWAYNSIGNDDYAILFTLDSNLAKKVTTAINKHGHDTPPKEAINEIASRIAENIATELNSDIPIGVSSKISSDTAYQHLTRSVLVTDILITADEQLIYIALIQTT